MNLPAVHLSVRVDVEAPPETVFAAVTDWERQKEWMLGTTVRIRHGDGRSVGSEVEAVTGLCGVGINDRMRIVQWNAPSRCEVRHLGRVVRGTGIFAVQPRGRGATLEWTEQLELPLGVLGKLGWPLVRPIFEWGLQRSLDRFAGFCRDYPR
ncbi:MAG: SRPBCC family protein [Pseudonocardiaceae bacterium]